MSKRLFITNQICKFNTLERYRSGHNEAVLKTVCPQGHMGSNPILSACPTGHMIQALGYWRSTQAAEGAPLERE